MKRFSRILCVFLALLLLPVSVSAQSTAVPGEAVSGPAPTIRVCLKRLALQDTADLTLDGLYMAESSQGTQVLFPQGASVTVRLCDGQLYLYRDGMSMTLGSSVTFTQMASGSSSLQGIRFIAGGNLYPGNLALSVSGGVIRPVLTISVEDYLMGVVPYEMSNSFPLEALKAQAVCARTYALSHVNGTDDYDLVDTTNDQVFRGIYEGNTRAIQAVKDTAGIVGTYKGKLATCYYSASNGGQTELPENAWPSRGKLSYYAMTDDPYDLENPESVVRRADLSRDGRDLPDEFLTLLRDAVKQQMEAGGFITDDLSCFAVTAISAVSVSGHTVSEESHYVSNLNVTFSWSGKKLLGEAAGSGEDYDLDELFGLPTATPRPEGTQRLSSFLSGGTDVTVTLSLFPDVVQAFGLVIPGTTNEQITIEETDTQFRICARRYGHGVGMSQRGAQWMAGHYGMTFVQILNFYYPGMDLSVVPSGAQEAPTARPELAATPGPSASPTPRPTLMPVTGTLPEGAWLASVEGIDDDSSLNLRSEPVSGDNIIMRLYKHQQLIVLDVSEDGIWAHVRTDTVEGYVMITYLKAVTADAQTSAAEATEAASSVLTPVEP